MDNPLHLLRSAVENASYSVLITTAELDLPGPQIVYVTPAFTRMTGYAAEDVLGRTPRMLQGPNTNRTALANLRRELRQGRSYTCDLANYRKDHSEFMVELTIDPVKDASGRITHFAALQRDITERKRAAEKLIQTERLAAIGAAMTGLAHESRNALQRAQACLELLADQLAGQPAALDLITKAGKAQDELVRLYEEVRSFAAPIRLHRQACHLGEAAEAAWDSLALARSGLEIEWSQQVDAADPVCPADPMGVNQVLRNILENAIAAVPSDAGEVSLQIADAQCHGRPALEIRVADNGPGLDAEQRKRIFEEFYTTKTHGTGLGMAIAKRLVETHGGTIAVGRPKLKQSGTEIIVTLPREAADC